MFKRRSLFWLTELDGGSITVEEAWQEAARAETNHSPNYNRKQRAQTGSEPWLWTPTSIPRWTSLPPFHSPKRKTSCDQCSNVWSVGHISLSNCHIYCSQLSRPGSSPRFTLLHFFAKWVHCSFAVFTTHTYSLPLFACCLHCSHLFTPAPRVLFLHRPLTRTQINSLFLQEAPAELSCYFTSLNADWT